MKSFLQLLVSLSATLATPLLSSGNPKSVFDATIYGYPFVVMAQKMHEQVEKVGGFNKIFVSPSLSNPQESQIPSPNGDTLYIYSWIDLRSAPVVFNAPNITDRFYIFEFMDFSTNIITSLSPRTTNPFSSTSVIIKRNDDKDVVADDAKTAVVASYSDYVWLVGRILVLAEEGDVEKAIAIGNTLSLSSFNPKLPIQILSNLPGPLPAPLQTSSKFPQNFEDFQSILAWTFQHVPPNDNSSIHQKYIESAVSPLPASIANAAFQAALLDIDYNLQGIAIRSKWATCLKIGDFGDNLLLRATVARKYLAGNLAKDAIYYVQYLDSWLRPLSGKNSYLFNLERPLPVKGFWSLAAYNSNHYFDANPINRYSVGTGTKGLVHNSFGGTKIILSHLPPSDPADFNNWLPIPNGTFNLMLRTYWPSEELLNGSFPIPPIERW